MEKCPKCKMVTVVYVGKRGETHNYECITCDTKFTSRGGRLKEVK